MQSLQLTSDQRERQQDFSAKFFNHRLTPKSLFKTFSQRSFQFGGQKKISSSTDFLGTLSTSSSFSLFLCFSFFLWLLLHIAFEYGAYFY